jgi:hypothetical protein
MAPDGRLWLYPEVSRRVKVRELDSLPISKARSMAVREFFRDPSIVPDFIDALPADPSRRGALWLRRGFAPHNDRKLDGRLVPLAGDPETGWYVIRTRDSETHILHGPSVAAAMFKSGWG